MMRVSATTLESFRLWSTGDWMPEAELIDTIQGIFKPNVKMMLGQAFGRCIERPARYRKDYGGYIVPIKFGEEWIDFPFTAMLIDRALQEYDPSGIFEAKTTKQYSQSLVVSKADQIIGTRIIETKAKTSAFDFDRYQDSVQWRFELDSFTGASSVTYKIFRLDDEDGTVILKDVDTFTMYPYPELHQDCLDIVRGFESYVYQRGLDECLREKQRMWG